MGSASSKEHDANQAELGTNPNNNANYPMHHHPQYYSQGSGGPPPSHREDPATGQAYHSGYNQQQQHAQRNYYAQDGSQRSSHGAADPIYAPSEAMDVDHASSESSSSLSTSLPPSQLDGKGGLLSVESDVGLAGKDQAVPMVFRWEHGGRNVYITGTFNGWSKQCPMHRSGNDFTYIANLTRGKHAYKFVVDDEWRFAPDQLTVADVEGNVNNFVDVSDFVPLSDFEQLEDEDGNADDGVYTREIPDIDEYTKEPPPLPPHLRHIILNKAPPSVDCRLLPVPQHVALNHLYCTAIKDGMMVLGITNRYKQKFVTTVYYSLMPGTN